MYGHPGKPIRADANPSDIVYQHCGWGSKLAGTERTEPLPLPDWADFVAKMEDAGGDTVAPSLRKQTFVLSVNLACNGWCSGATR